MRRSLAGAVLAVLGLLCWLQAMTVSGQLRDVPRNYRVQLAAAEPLSAAALELLDDEQAAYSLAQETAAEVTAPQFDRKRTLLLLEVQGDPAQLFPLSRLVAGAYPPASEGGCIIDADSALALWGDTQVVGKMVECAGREYRVAGIMDCPRPLLLVHRDGREEFAPTHLAYRPDPAAVFPRQDVDSFLDRLSLPEAVADSARTADLVRLGAMFPAWLFLLLVAARTLRILLSRCWVRLMILSTVAVAAAWALDFPPLLTPEGVPTRWSDFSFWRQSIDAAAEQLSALWLLPGTVADYVLLWGAVLPAVGWSVGALAGFLAAAWLLRERGDER